jgi:hypothetical protein
MCDYVCVCVCVCVSSRLYLILLAYRIRRFSSFMYFFTSLSKNFADIVSTERRARHLGHRIAPLFIRILQ